ncbi:MAG: M48 family metallopeptidase [Planctomycetota bacterium]|jgi:predicted Zn-dependent protease
MAGFFYKLGRKVGPSVRKVQWLWKSMTAEQAEAICAEYAVGRDLALEVKERLELEEKPESVELIKNLGHRLSRCVANKEYKFSFAVYRAKEPNAFALPGGFIFISHSLGHLCEWDKDELAFVLAHEMAHVIRGHAIERLVSNSAISIAAGALPARSALAGWLVKVGANFFEKAYSRERELQADELGIRLAAAAGYDMDEGLKFISQLGQLTDSKEFAGVGKYFSTHPSFEERIENINNLKLNK